MDPITLAALGLTAGKAAYGAHQTHKGNKLAKQAQRSEYEIPSAVNEQLKIAKAQALNTRLPGQSMAEENISGGVQTGVRAAKESGNNPAAIMATISALNANQNQAYQGLATKGAEMQQANIANLQNTLGNYANFQDKAFSYNKDEPFKDKVAAAEAMKGAGTQNIYGAASDAAGIGMQAMANKQELDVLDKKAAMYKTGQGASAGTNTNKMMLEQKGINTANLTPEQMMQYVQILGIS